MNLLLFDKRRRNTKERKRGVQPALCLHEKMGDMQ